VVAGTGCKQQLPLAALNRTVEGKRGSWTDKGPAPATVDAEELAKRAAEASDDIGAIIKRINGIADRISSEASRCEAVASGRALRASRKLREMAVRLQLVARGYAGPAAAEEARDQQRIPIRESWRLGRAGGDCKEGRVRDVG
jgi:hypothetical protein